MNPAPFADKPTLTGDLVQLRPFGPDDVAVMAEIISDPELIRLTGSAHTSTEIAEASAEPDETLRAWYTTRGEHADRLDLGIVDRSTGTLVGEVVLNELEPANLACNLRILIGPAGRNRGLGTESVRLVVDHAFRATELYRIELEVYAFNPRAQRSYEKAGFVHEGRRRAAFRFDDEHIDSIIMSILRRDWAATQD